MTEYSRLPPLMRARYPAPSQNARIASGFSPLTRRGRS